MNAARARRLVRARPRCYPYVTGIAPAKKVRIHRGKNVLPMETKLSTKGQVVLPEPIRRKLGLQPGDTLDATVENGAVTLRPHAKRRRKPRIVADALSGLPVLDPGSDAPVLTSKSVRAILEEMP